MRSLMLQLYGGLFPRKKDKYIYGGLLIRYATEMRSLLILYRCNS